MSTNSYKYIKFFYFHSNLEKSVKEFEKSEYFSSFLQLFNSHFSSGKRV